MRGVFGDDIDGAANGGAPKKGGTTTTHHFDTLNHVGWNLLKTIDARQSGENGTGVHQNLRIVTIQTVDAHLRETTVLAIILHAHAGLEVQSVGKTNCSDIGEKFAAHDLNERGTFPANRLVLVARHHDLLQPYHVGQKFKLHLNGPVAHHLHLLRNGDETQSRCLQTIGSFFQVFQKKMTCGVGRCRQSLALLRNETNGTVRKMLPSFFNHMPRDVGIGKDRRRRIEMRTRNMH